MAALVRGPPITPRRRKDGPGAHRRASGGCRQGSVQRPGSREVVRWRLGAASRGTKGDGFVPNIGECAVAWGGFRSWPGGKVLPSIQENCRRSSLAQLRVLCGAKRRRVFRRVFSAFARHRSLAAGIRRPVSWTRQEEPTSLQFLKPRRSKNHGGVGPLSRRLPAAPPPVAATLPSPA